MLFYFLLGLSFFLLTRPDSLKHRELGYCIASIMFIVVAAIRYDIGFDYDQYYTIIEERIWAGMLRFEPIPMLFCVISILLDYTPLFFIITSFVAYSLVFRSFRCNSVLPAFSMAIFIALFYPISLSIVRQCLAVAICLSSYPFIRERKFWKFAFLIMVASLCHYSAVVSLFVYFVYWRLSMLKIIVFAISAFFFKTFIFSLLASYGLYVSYLNGLNDYAGGSITFLVNIALLLLPLAFDKYKNFEPEQKRLYKVVALAIFIPLIFGHLLGERLGYYYWLYICYLLPISLKSRKPLLRLFICLGFIAYFLFSVFYSSVVNSDSPYLPYATIFNSAHVGFR